MNSKPHKIFGTKQNAVYTDRYGAYLIPVKDGKIGIVKTHRGFFLLGGGAEPNETDAVCIARECLEETGYSCTVKECIGSAEAYTVHDRLGPFHPMQRYYYGELTDKTTQPTEQDHCLIWCSPTEAADCMYAEMQSWAIGEFAEKYTHLFIQPL